MQSACDSAVLSAGGVRDRRGGGWVGAWRRDPIDPRTEREGQPNCGPIDWRFTFGTSYRSRAVRGPWGALSIVTDPDGGNVPVTKATVPARDFDGHPVSGGVNRSALWSPRTCAPAGEHSASHEPTTATTPTFMRIRSHPSGRGSPASLAAGDLASAGGTSAPSLTTQITDRLGTAARYR
jgi:hypothetical protein